MDITAKVENQADVGENGEKLPDTKKLGSLSKIFRFKSIKSNVDSIDMDSINLKVPKTSTLSRFLGKKSTDSIKDGDNEGSIRKPKSSFFMRNLVIPWISKKSSQVNLQTAEKELVEIPIKPNFDNEMPQEIVAISEIF